MYALVKYAISTWFEFPLKVSNQSVLNNQLVLSAGLNKVEMCRCEKQQGRCKVEPKKTSSGQFIFKINPADAVSPRFSWSNAADLHFRPVLLPREILTLNCSEYVLCAHALTNMHINNFQIAYIESRALHIWEVCIHFIQTQHAVYLRDHLGSVYSHSRTHIFILGLHYFAVLKLVVLQYGRSYILG